jgi:hypothetical protein
MNSLPTQIKKNNKTGVTGVAFTDSFYHSYIANGSGKRFSKKFSIAKYGEYEALRLAVKWRRDNELKIHGYSVIPKQLIYRNSNHIQSTREAEKMRLLKKRAAFECRENIQRELAQQKKSFQKKAGKYIYRIDDLNSGHGWLLRIEIQKEILFNMLFRDSRYGSARDALRFAKMERDKQLKLHNLPYAKGRRFSKKLRSTNSTGVTGVCRSCFYYHCYIPLQPNKRKTRKISIDKYGEKLAFQLAIEWRREKEIEVYGDTVLTSQQIRKILRTYS